MAAGDVLVTIKAKYESVNAALKSLKGLDKAIVDINKRKINVNAAATNRAVVELTGNIKGATQALTGFKGKSTFINKFGSSIRDLNSQLASANKGLLEESKAAQRAEAALMGMGVAFKKLRIQQQAYREGSKNLFKASGKGGAISDKDYLPDFKALKKDLGALAQAKASAFEISSALEEVRYLLNYATEESKEWKDLLKLENKLLEKQVKLQEKAANFTKEKARAARDSATAQGPSSVRKTGIPEFDRFNVAGMESTQSTILEMSTRLAGQTGVPQNEIIKAFSTGGKALDDMSKRLMKLQGVTDQASDELVKLANAATEAAATAKKPDGRFDSTGRKLSVGERFNRRFGANYGRGGIWGEGNLPNRGFREKRRGMRRGLGSKMGQSMLLGGGFPMLFGGGAGAVGGSLAGSGLAGMMGMPSAAFGLQIAGSAIGTMLENNIRQAKELADALDTANMDKLLDQGIRLSAQMQFQVKLLQKQGDYQGAKRIMEKQVFMQTGGSAGNFKDVSNAVNILGAAWNDFKATVALTLGIIAAPFLVALAGILKIVTTIAQGVNLIANGLKIAVDWMYELMPDPIKDAWEGLMDSINEGLQKNIAAAAVLNEEMYQQSKELDKQYETRMGIRPMIDRMTGEKSYMKINPYTESEKITHMTQQMGLKADKYRKEEMKEFKLSNEYASIASQDNKQAEAAAMLSNKAKLIEKEIKTNLLLEDTIRLQKMRKDMMVSTAKAQSEINLLTAESTKNELVRIAQEKGLPQEAKRLEAAFKLRKEQETLNQLRGKYKIFGVEIKKDLGATLAIQKQELVVQEASIALGNIKTDQVKQIEELWKKVGDAIENSIVSAIENAITKAQSFQDILSSLLMSVGRMFLSAGVNTMMGNMFPSLKAAEGAYVDGPTNALIGEGGEPEYVIPDSKMTDAMDRYAEGARGNDVLAGGGVEGGSDSGVSGGMNGIDVTFNTQVINDVSYVSYTEFQEGVQQAAAQGAKLGEQATLRKLQTSPSTRRRVGV